MEITKDQFKAYEYVRQSGFTNMWAINTVSELSGLEKPVIREIMSQYTELNKKWPDVRKQ